MKKNSRESAARLLTFLICGLCLIAMGGVYGWRLLQHRQANAAKIGTLLTQLVEKNDAVYLHVYDRMDDYGAELIHAETVRLEEERIRLELERLEQERLEKERLEKERLEQERLEKERLERERRERERQRILALEQAAAARVARRIELLQELSLAQIMAASQKNLPEPELTPEEKAIREERSRILKEQGERALAENKAYKEKNPKATVALKVPVIHQQDVLPNGCEITSLAMVLRYLGFTVDLQSLSDTYLPQFPLYLDATGQRIGANPDLYYLGNPKDKKNAFYCYAGPIVDAANAFLANAGSQLRGRDLTGATESQLTAQLRAGRPVVVWGTLSMGEPLRTLDSDWLCVDDGKIYKPYSNLHCVVLTGYDKEFFYFSDPLRGEFAYYRKTFMAAFQAMGSRAMTVLDPVLEQAEIG